MNDALHDVHHRRQRLGAQVRPGRIGAGRVDPQGSALASVIAFDSDQSGVVSVTFDAPVVGVVSQVKHVRVVNHGATAATYDLGIDLRNDAPGIAFSLPGGSTVTVPAGQTAEFDVRMDGNANQMRHVRDVTVAPTQAAPGPLAGLGNLVRHWDTEEEGYITLSQSGNVKLKVPLYMAARPASAMCGRQHRSSTGGANTGATTIALSGTDVCTGTLGAGPVCTCHHRRPTFDEVSLVSPFELQAVSALDPVNAPPAADLQYAGVAYDPVNNLHPLRRLDLGQLVDSHRGGVQHLHRQQLRRHLRPHPLQQQPRHRGLGALRQHRQRRRTASSTPSSTWRPPG